MMILESDDEAQGDVSEQALSTDSTGINNWRSAYKP